MVKSQIEWTEATWSPVIGCTKVSQGCKNCYAEREVETRWSKNPRSIWYGRAFSDVLCRPEAVSGAGSPLTWKRPRRIFVCPRADLFHEAVPLEFIDDVFRIMALAPQHTFQVLTKRPQRMLEYLGSQPPWRAHTTAKEHIAYRVPASNIWLGVSVENQETADERIPLLLQTPAAVRWLSMEPLLEPVRLNLATPCDRQCSEFQHAECPGNPGEPCRMQWAIDWVVVGGESGPKARPFDVAWARSIIAQCKAAGVPVFMKQLGSNIGWNGMQNADNRWPGAEPNREDTGKGYWRVRLIDRAGADPAEWPEDLRVRRFPEDEEGRKFVEELREGFAA